MADLDFEVPGNVPRERVVDFDFSMLGGVDVDIQLDWKRLHDLPDIVWTPRNGGHWIATRAEDIDTIKRDYAHFSHAHYALPRNKSEFKMVPLSLDPPEHAPYRRVLMPAFLPKAVKKLEDVARETARTLVADIAPRGHCEFINDFAKVLPMNVFLKMVDLPLGDREMLVALVEPAVRSNDIEAKNAADRQLVAYTLEVIDARMEKPGDDLFSHIIKSEVDGRRLTRQEVLGMCMLLLHGGLDTVASQLGFIATFLARNPAHRRRLIEEPGIHAIAIEELLRRYGLPNTARILTEDYEFKGVHFRKGDMIQLPICLFGLDERINESPEKVDFDRKPSTIKHQAFGVGAHTCPGAVLARREIAIFLEEWLPRIPDFEVDPERPPVTEGGMVCGVRELHLVWEAA